MYCKTVHLLFMHTNWCCYSCQSAVFQTLYLTEVYPHIILTVAKSFPNKLDGKNICSGSPQFTTRAQDAVEKIIMMMCHFVALTPPPIYAKSHAFRHVGCKLLTAGECVADGTASAPGVYRYRNKF